MLFAPDAKRPVDFLSTGDAFWEAGRHCEALDFYERIPDEAVKRDRLARVLAFAVGMGDAFVVNRLATKGNATKDDWVATAKAARAAGRLRYALKAAIAAGDEAQAAELREKLGIAKPLVEGAERP